MGQGTLGLSGGSTIDPLNAILDMSGLDNLTVDANHILLGDGGVAGFFFNRPAGTIYLARTNRITLWAVGAHPSANQVTGGIIAGIIAQNNGGGYTRIGKLVLGQTNAIFCNSGINLGIRGFSGWIGFNPSNAPGSGWLLPRSSGHWPTIALERGKPIKRQFRRKHFWRAGFLAGDG